MPKVTIALLHFFFSSKTSLSISINGPFSYILLIAEAEKCKQLIVKTHNNDLGDHKLDLFNAH